ncbi:PREDICTED: uncharacterized mitochondrial protein AtMg00810-like [Polistes dominula]|uniref:Uncharacterized mitochondrial protein AtMg00810-like n=1 Tax=Polistes dominula TaxID=743375 RepID=A0ABM1J4Y7_POLDO|nr:PREDICTED: uncharacterized mitochondrial protein AtMg00810-like [Polistes dominula]
MIAAINVPEKLDEIISHFSNVFEMKTLGEPENFLGVEIHRERNDSNVPTNARYREAIGTLLYLADATRPNIAYAVNLLSRRQNNPTEGDWTEVKRIFRYLRGTTDLGLYYRDREKSTSTIGYIIQVYGDIVAWRSHKQSSPVTSTCQTEYLTMSESCKEIIFLDKATRDIIGKSMYPVSIRCDNKSACNCT